MPGEFILSIDQGTTNTKALLVDRRGEAVFRVSVPLEISQPQASFVEQDPVEIWKSVLTVAMECASYARESGAEIAGIAITNQRETALAWQREIGRAVV